MTRRTSLFVLLALTLSGCGGGGGSDNNEARVTNTGGTGRIADVLFDPAPGGVFVGLSRTFSLAWTNPPSEYTASLHRYKEARGGQARSVEKQKIALTRGTSGLGTSLWLLQRRDNFDLDSQGVYYVELGQPGQDTVRSCYIVSGDRSAAARATITTGATRGENTGQLGTTGRLSDVQIFPRPGSTFIARNQTFQFRWPDGTTPPPRVNVQLRRYKEPRGDDGKVDEEQQISLDRQGDTFVWNVERRDNFDLDRAGVYYLELTSDGEQIRAAYIVENN